MISTPLWDGKILPKCHCAGNKRPLPANLHVQMSIIFVSAAVEFNMEKLATLWSAVRNLLSSGRRSYSLDIHGSALECSAEKPLILTFIWITLDTTHILNTHSDLALIAMAHPLDIGPPSRTSVLLHCKNSSGTARRTWQRKCQPGLNLSQSVWASMRYTSKIPIHGGPVFNENWLLPIRTPGVKGVGRCWSFESFGLFCRASMDWSGGTLSCWGYHCHVGVLVFWIKVHLHESQDTRISHCSEMIDVSHLTTVSGFSIVADWCKTPNN